LKFHNNFSIEQVNKDTDCTEKPSRHHSIFEVESEKGKGVTPDFPKKTKCKPICMPGSSFMHIVT
jgi:hypothetical protein